MNKNSVRLTSVFLWTLNVAFVTLNFFDVFISYFASQLLLFGFCLYFLTKAINEYRGNKIK
jgi:hypothetical protein